VLAFQVANAGTRVAAFLPHEANPKYPAARYTTRAVRFLTREADKHSRDWGNRFRDADNENRFVQCHAIGGLNQKRGFGNELGGRIG
jgi:hypothetical protein